MPYQIIHTFEGFLNEPQLDGMAVLLGRNEERLNAVNIDEVLPERLKALKDSGIDGLVVNIGGEGYLESREGREVFSKGLSMAIRFGFKIWIYDEKGYPSGSAGGLVLRDIPQLEAIGIKKARVLAKHGRAEFIFMEKGEIRVLACEAEYESGEKIAVRHPDIGNNDRMVYNKTGCSIHMEDGGLTALNIFYAAVLYEGTHASRSYAEKRRYINLLDSKAVKSFIEYTHQCYAEIIPDGDFQKIEAFFTDEPSFMSVVMNELDDSLQSPIPVLDVPDPDVPVLPSIPYSSELEEEFFHIYGMKFHEIVMELFSAGEMPSPMKCAFWETVSMVYEKTFALQLSNACQKLGKKLTGHILFEEAPFENMIFHANPFRVLKHFHLPGVDLLTNHLNNISVFGHKLVFSCAILSGKNGIMSETSDFCEHRLGMKKPASPDSMVSMMFLQFLLGVREFCYYYDFRARNREEYRHVNDVVGNMCSYAKDHHLKYKPEIAVYCPYETFWSGYVPTCATLGEVLAEQPSNLKDAQNDLLKLCEDLFFKNIQFILCDGSSLCELMKTGINKVIIPRCKVVSEELLDAGASGLLELYGHKPELSYAKGKLERISHWSIQSLERFMQVYMPFDADVPLYAFFEGDKYFFFNQKKDAAVIKMSQTASVYDPYTDSRILLNGGQQLEILPGKALFIDYEVNSQGGYCGDCKKS